MSTRAEMDARELDVHHVTRRALDRMLPFATTAGGSFARWLPSPRERDLGASEELFAAAKLMATRQCLRSLSASNDLAGGTATGEREWPQGYCGSVTHKGTVVLAAIAEMSTCGSLGIDLERVIDGHLSHAVSDIAPEGLPSGMPLELAATCAFSAKEAVFKADFSVQRQPLGYADVRVGWEATPLIFRAIAQVGRRQYHVLGAVLEALWVLTVAVSRFPTQS